MITYHQLENMLLQRGVVGVVKKGAKPFFAFGFRGGTYLGAPGKDIYFALVNMTDDEKNSIATLLANLYPHKPPSNHVKWAACIRYIYGCFEKQGCLRSNYDKKRMIDEDPDWNLPMDFMDRVAKQFKESNNIYGLVIHYEMLAHRYGDKAIIENDKTYLVRMMDCYNESNELAIKIKCWKQTFTPFYWAAGYYKEMGEPNISLLYYKKCLKYMEKYCPDARDGYREKVRISIQAIKKYSTDDEWRRFCRWYRKCKNKCLRRVKI